MADAHWTRVVRADVTAGLTVTLVGLPQCLAYALMSGLPPAYGLSTAAVAGFVAALAGLSPHVVTGPTNTTGLLILGALGPYLGSTGLLEKDGLPALATLTLMAGSLRVLLAYLGGAKLLRYLPESVLAGFTAGAGVLIGLMQLDEALGMRPLAGGGLWSQVSGFLSRFSAGEGPSVLGVSVTVTTIAAIHYGKRFLPRWPVALVTIVVGAAAAWSLSELELGLLVVKDRAEVPAGWPPGALPLLDLDLIRGFFVPALAIVLLGTLELTVSARADGAQPNMRR
ncbi:MAG: SulP family inorganic anion transporter, partial [Myxococcota bacterium]